MTDEEIADAMYLAEALLQPRIERADAEWAIEELVRAGWSPSGIAQTVRIDNLESELQECAESWSLFARLAEENVADENAETPDWQGLAALCRQAAERCTTVASAGLPTRHGDES